MKPVTISDPAREEFRDAARWYRDRDERVAARFTAETGRILELIGRFPNIGSRVPGIDDLAVRRMPVHNFPYHVVFIDLGDRIEIAAFAHKRRRPEYLVERLRRF
ncbi:MAG TPA: type II toxin-antitoxin system RelE/ParE family toxin [Thermoanaerobaculia bacterium]|nr:type II toxin-antitoxin system RelE/ParE family toxin [Thermoanaerobaculia bacterium]